MVEKRQLLRSFASLCRKMARKSFTLKKSTLGARAIFLLIEGSRAAVNAQDDSASNFSHLLWLSAGRAKRTTSSALAGG
jgi:hypothetical protein